VRLDDRQLGASDDPRCAPAGARQRRGWSSDLTTGYDVRRTLGAVDAEQAIRLAIRERRLIEFRLHGLRRIAEPHLYGVYRGARQLLLYQVGGESKSGDLPDWRRAGLPEISDVRLLDECFDGPRLPSPRHTQWDIVLERVE
jgi:hypothetical protein